MYLRARYYNPYLNQFIQPDTIVPDPRIPADLNKYTYVRDNPINYVDPSGRIAQSEDFTAQVIAADLHIRFSVDIVKDWGYGYTSPYQTFINDILDGKNPIIDTDCGWRSGNWRNLNELELVRHGIELLAMKMGGAEKFKAAMKHWPVEIARVKTLLPPFSDNTGLAFPETFGYYMVHGIMLPDGAFGSDQHAIYTTVHELGHAWDIRWNLDFSLGMAEFLGNGRNGDVSGLEFCESLSDDPMDRFLCAMAWPINDSERGYWEYNEANEAAPGTAGGQYAKVSLAEDWAESVAYTVYPDYGISRGDLPILAKRRTYVEVMMDLIP